MEEYNPSPPRKTRTDQRKHQTNLKDKYLRSFPPTFGGILFDNFELTGPGMQYAIFVAVRQVHCSIFEVRRQEKR